VGDVWEAKRYVFSTLVHYKRIHDLLSREDKKGIHPKASDYNLEDIRLQGYPFTWSKSIETSRMVEENID
jgi:hypothetical protein